MQAGELLAQFAPIPDPVLLLGDFNSRPGMSSYQLLAGQFKDTYTVAGGLASEGFTCCQESDLRNATSTADGRIDLVLYRGRFRVIDVTVEGISLVSNFRDQFKEVLARGGPEELLQALRAKNAAGPAEAS